MRGDSNRTTLFSYSTGITTIFSVVNYIITNATANTVVAIDAPLIIKNSDGQRPCENLIGKKFGRYKASARSSNLTRYPNAGSIQVAQLLEQNGFSHTPDPTTDKHKKGCRFFEVYPHPAMVVLFNLEKIIKYKKGSVADKRKGLEILRRYIKTNFAQGKPILQPNEKFEELLNRDLHTLKGKALKHYEDILDALVCAYLALYYWMWAAEKTEMIGDLETGNKWYYDIKKMGNQ